MRRRTVDSMQPNYYHLSTSVTSAPLRQTSLVSRGWTVTRSGKRILFRTCALFTSLVLCLSLAEGFLRLFPASLPYDVRKALEAQSKDLGIAHPYVGYLHQPLHTGVMSSLDF